MDVRRFLAAAALAALVLAGCARTETADRAPLTERQRDSVLAEQPLPGAPVVGSALKASDRAAERAAAMDSTAR